MSHPLKSASLNWPIPKPLPNHPMWNAAQSDYILFMSVPIKTHAVARAHGRGVGSVQRLAVVSLVAAQNGSVGCYHIALQLHSHLQRLQRGVNVNYRHFQGVMQIPSGFGYEFVAELKAEESCSCDRLLDRCGWCLFYFSLFCGLEVWLKNQVVKYSLCFGLLVFESKILKSKKPQSPRWSINWTWT